VCRDSSGARSGQLGRGVMATQSGHAAVDRAVKPRTTSWQRITNALLCPSCAPSSSRACVSVQSYGNDAYRRSLSPHPR
jgi:hypothetical protein